jgi:hypothetical protein
VDLIENHHIFHNDFNVPQQSVPIQLVEIELARAAYPSLVSTNLTVILAPPLPFSLRHTFIPLV